MIFGIITKFFVNSILFLFIISISISCIYHDSWIHLIVLNIITWFYYYAAFMNYYYTKDVVVSSKRLNFLTTLDESNGSFIEAK